MSQPRVRSTTQRRGSGVNPLVAGSRRTISHVDAEGGGVFDEVLAVAAVDPGLADGWVGGGDLVDEGACRRWSPARWRR